MKTKKAKSWNQIAKQHMEHVVIELENHRDRALGVSVHAQNGGHKSSAANALRIAEAFSAAIDVLHGPRIALEPGNNIRAVKGRP